MKMFAMMMAATFVAVSPTTSAFAQDRVNALVGKLAAGDAVEGVFYSTLDFNSARVTRGSDLDYIIIDMEHHAFDAETLRQFLITVRTPDGTFRSHPSCDWVRRAARCTCSVGSSNRR